MARPSNRECNQGISQSFDAITPGHTLQPALRDRRRAVPGAQYRTRHGPISVCVSSGRHHLPERSPEVQRRLGCPQSALQGQKGMANQDLISS